MKKTIAGGPSEAGENGIKAQKREWLNCITPSRIDPRAFYLGATAIEQAWRQHYPAEPAPPWRTLGQILKDLGLAGRYHPGRQKGAWRALCYPEHTVYEKLGARVMEAGFIGQKDLRGRSQPRHFMAFYL